MDILNSYFCTISKALLVLISLLLNEFQEIINFLIAFVLTEYENLYALTLSYTSLEMCFLVNGYTITNKMFSSSIFRLLNFNTCQLPKKFSFHVYFLFN